MSAQCRYFAIVHVLFLGMCCDWLTQLDASHRCNAAMIFAYSGPPPPKNCPLLLGICTPV